MTITDNATHTVRETRGLVLGFIGVLCFSASLPFTHVAVRDFGVIFPSFGRAVIAAALASVALRITHTPLPPRDLWAPLARVVGGVVIGFPAFTGLALQHAPAGHGSVVIGLLPAATAGFSVLRTGHRPSRRYWMFAALGAGAIVVLTIARGTTDIALGDLYLVGAIASAAIGYTEGAMVSRHIGGWQTISWAVVFGLPITVPLALIGLGPVGFHEPATAWIALGYLGAVSMFLGFFAWYAGLARAGIARGGQLQLAQPLLSVLWGWVLLGETPTARVAVAAALVLVAVTVGRRAPVRGIVRT